MILFIPSQARIKSGSPARFDLQPTPPMPTDRARRSTMAAHRPTSQAFGSGRGANANTYARTSSRALSRSKSRSRGGGGGGGMGGMGGGMGGDGRRHGRRHGRGMGGMM